MSWSHTPCCQNPLTTLSTILNHRYPMHWMHSRLQSFARPLIQINSLHYGDLQWCAVTCRRLWVSNLCHSNWAVGSATVYARPAGPQSPMAPRNYIANVFFHSPISGRNCFQDEEVRLILLPVRGSHNLPGPSVFLSASLQPPRHTHKCYRQSSYCDN